MKLIADLMNTSPAVEVIFAKVDSNGQKISKPYLALIDTGSHYNYAWSAIFEFEEIEMTGVERTYMEFGDIPETREEYKTSINIVGLSSSTLFDFYFMKKDKLIHPFQVIIGTQFLIDFGLSINIERGKLTLERLHE